MWLDGFLSYLGTPAHVYHHKVSSWYQLKLHKGLFVAIHLWACLTTSDLLKITIVVSFHCISNKPMFSTRWGFELWSSSIYMQQWNFLVTFQLLLLQTDHGDGLVQDCSISTANTLETFQSSTMDGLVQACSISTANALEILHSCTNKSMLLVCCWLLISPLLYDISFFSVMELFQRSIYLCDWWTELAARII